MSAANLHNRWTRVLGLLERCKVRKPYHTPSDFVVSYYAAQLAEALTEHVEAKEMPEPDVVVDETVGAE